MSEINRIERTGPREVQETEITSFEERVTIIEDSMSALVELQTNSGQPIVITHDCYNPGNTESYLNILVQPDTELHIGVWVEEKEQHRRRKLPGYPIAATYGTVRFKTTCAQPEQGPEPTNIDALEAAILRVFGDTYDTNDVREAARVALDHLNNFADTRPR